MIVISYVFIYFEIIAVIAVLIDENTSLSQFKKKYMPLKSITESKIQQVKL